MTASPPAAAVDAWRQLIPAAGAEQALLERALASLFTDADLDQRIGRALDYPHWPQPLTRLPELAPHLAAATADLDTYLRNADDATDHVLHTIAAHGWPYGDLAGTAADAAWLLLQHADRRNADRAGLLPTLARAVHDGWADPRHLALLTDREHTIRGEPQPYGTFVLVRDDQPRYLYPVADPDNVEDRRTTIGLPAWFADAHYAYSPIIPFGAARSTPVNPARHHRDLDPDVEGAPPPPDLDLEPARDRIGVYLAATLRHRDQTRRVRAGLPAALTSTGRWLDIDPLTRPSCQYDAGIALNRLAARLCAADIRRADTLIALTYSHRSAGVSTEIGYALANNRQVILVGASQCSFDMLPQVTVVPDLDTAIHAALTRTTDPPKARRHAE